MKNGGSDIGGPDHFARLASSMGSPPASSASWDDFHIQTLRLAPGGWSHPSSRFVRLTVPLSQPGRVRRRLPGDNRHWVPGLKRPGTISVTPPGTDGDWEWLDLSHFGLIFVPETLVREALDERGADRSHISLRPAYAEPDQIVGPIFQALQAEIGREQRSSRLLVSSAALFLTRHVLATYGDQTHPARALAPIGNIGLQRVLDAVEARLSHDWSVPEMAREAGMSTFWFAHAFKQKLGLTPRRFVQYRRLARARLLLAKSALSIADIAAHCGFESQSWFTTMFRRQFGVTPAVYRQRVR